MRNCIIWCKNCTLINQNLYMYVLYNKNTLGNLIWIIIYAIDNKVINVDECTCLRKTVAEVIAMMKQFEYILNIQQTNVLNI